MTKKLLLLIFRLHKIGVDSRKDQIPYWTEFLDQEYGDFDYTSELECIKTLGYRVYRNADGKHKLVYEDGMREV